MSETVSDQEIAKMLDDGAPHLAVVKSPQSIGEEAPPEKTVEQEEQEKFDAVMDGPFTPEALKDAAITSFKYRLPKFLHSTQMQMKQHAARGAFIVELDSQGAKNYQLGVVRELKALGFAADIDGTKIVVPLVADSETLITSGQV